jgi:prepilin-type N-terminal cleavage/methylation domain-containing protein
MTRSKARRRPPRRRGGFTLTELMIALGILGIGLGMASAAFHAGLQSHDATMDEIIRTMVGSNALAIARARLRNGTNPPDVSESLSMPAKIGLEDRKFPVARDSGRGYLLLARQAVPDENVYEFVVVPYIVGQPGNYVETDTVSDIWVVWSGTISKIMVWDPAQLASLPVGGVILTIDENGTMKMAEITAHEMGMYAVLDSKISRDLFEVTTLVVKDSTGNVTEDTPEFMDPYTVRSSLPPAEVD